MRTRFVGTLCVVALVSFVLGTLWGLSMHGVGDSSRDHSRTVLPVTERRAGKHNHQSKKNSVPAGQNAFTSTTTTTTTAAADVETTTTTLPTFISEKRHHKHHHPHNPVHEQHKDPPLRICGKDGGPLTQIKYIKV